MKKLGVHIVAFNEERNIVPVIKQFEPLGIKTVVAVSMKPWHTGLAADNTYELAKTTNAEVYKGDWGREHEQRNFCLDKLSDCDYIIVGHADTFFTQESLRNIIHEINKETEEDIRCWDIMTKMYWKNWETVIVPDLILPTMIIKPHERFEHAINIVDRPGYSPIMQGVTCHHLSWAKTDEEVLTKIQTYEHAEEIVHKDWYESVWKNWKPSMRNIAPTNPVDYHKTTKYSLPEDIRRYFA